MIVVVNIHGPRTNPQIYNKGTGAVFPWDYWLDIAKSDPAALYGLLAQGSILMLQAQAPKIDGTYEAGKLIHTNEANFYLFETMRLLQKKIDNPADALSNATVFVAAVLTTCVVSVFFVHALDSSTPSTLILHSKWLSFSLSSHVFNARLLEMEILRISHLDFEFL